MRAPVPRSLRPLGFALGGVLIGLALGVGGCAFGESSRALQNDAAVSCVDNDRDGFGEHCARGRDCDDENPHLTNQCAHCARPDLGCPCSDDELRVACFQPDEALLGGGVMCHQGTRKCQAGRWGACEDVRAYLAAPQRAATSLINAAAAPENCSICDVRCFKVTDQLLAGSGAPGSNIRYATSGGLTLTAADAGPADAGAPDAGDAGGPLFGCAALSACCDTLSIQPTAASDCYATVTAGIGIACDVAIRLYCPTVIYGPIGGCTTGASTVDSDCDGIPDAFDECTTATVATNPACGGSVLPLPTTLNQAIFHVLEKGQSANNSLQIGYKVQNADVYFLMDMSDTMSDERNALIAGLTSGDLVECALLKNCCDRLTGAMQTACLGVVGNDNQATCKTKTATYCPNKKLLDCPDIDLDGAPDNALKTQGVLGAVRCLVGSSWFGTGYFREIPFRDGVSYTGLGGKDSSGFQDRGNGDEHAFRHWVDMSSDVTKIASALGNFTTDVNYDFPEPDIVALYSLATGKGQMFGNKSVNVAERAGAGCAAGAFGYPCFRSTSIPIVLLFTDDPLNNGPPSYKAKGGETPATYDATYKLNGKAPTSGVARFTPAQAETFGSALELGDLRKRFTIASGNTREMKGDYNAMVTGCGAATAAPDAVYRFELSAMDTVPFAINVTQDPLGYSDSFLTPNVPTPATDFPVVLSLYRGDPTSGGTLVQCQGVCPPIDPFNACRPLTEACSSNSQCCSNKCTSSKCAGTDPPSTQACKKADLSATGFTATLAAGTYYVTVKGQRTGQAGFYELQIGDPNNGSAATTYIAPSWIQTRDALTQAGIKLLPVISCDKGSNNGRCDGAAAQAQLIAESTGAIDAKTGKGLLSYIKPDGTGLGSGLALAVRDLANYLALDITLGAVGNPGFDIQVQKCTNPLDPGQAVCKTFSSGCQDGSPVPKNTVAGCQPGGTPIFVVKITNPPDPNSVPASSSDPFGGYHFKLQLVGNHQHLLEEIPVYIIPTPGAGPPPPPGPTFPTSGSYEQALYGAGCSYAQQEGEARGSNSCSDGLDNDGDGNTDDADDGCKPGSCLDGVDNDGDSKLDMLDPECQSNQQQDWSDLFFKADIPVGTSISFEMCTASDTAALASCSFSPIATVSSSLSTCASNADCRNVALGGTFKDGFCGTGGQCQFIDPPKLSGPCSTDADCPNGSLNGAIIASSCDVAVGRCSYRTPPADIAAHLPPGANGKPYARLRITLNPDAARSKSPTLYEWYLQYYCQNDL